MKSFIAATMIAFLAVGANAFAPNAPSFGVARSDSSSSLYAKYNSVEEILALFPDDKPTLINFYDAAMEEEIKNDIVTLKRVMEGRASVCSAKVQDYPEIAKLWDATDSSPTMILFKDGKPVCRVVGEYHFLEVSAKIGRFCE
mmetsp:Transcript_9431/g.12229  ORF Transcript_9431/g.12229 Transcript_9431/m.12229 type:complete len:143 (-) Transcript_9431:734-1162(-)